MLKNWLPRFAKITLISTIGIFGFAFSHVSASASSPMPDMSGHGSIKNVQCQSSCMSALPGNKEELLQIQKDDDDPNPQPYYIGLIAVGILAALFVASRSAAFTSSWRPPDLVKLYGQRLFYA